MHQLSPSGQIAHRPIPASAAGLYLGSECMVAYPDVSLRYLRVAGENEAAGAAVTAVLAVEWLCSRDRV